MLTQVGQLQPKLRCVDLYVLFDRFELAFP